MGSFTREARRSALERISGWDDHERWTSALHDASREGLAASSGGIDLRELAADVLTIAREGAPRAACIGDADAAIRTLESLAHHHALDLATR